MVLFYEESRKEPPNFYVLSYILLESIFIMSGYLNEGVRCINKVHTY